MWVSSVSWRAACKEREPEMRRNFELNQTASLVPFFRQHKAGSWLHTAMDPLSGAASGQSRGERGGAGCLHVKHLYTMKYVYAVY